MHKSKRALALGLAQRGVQAQHIRHAALDAVNNRRKPTNVHNVGRLGRPRSRVVRAWQHVKDERVGGGRAARQRCANHIKSSIVRNVVAVVEQLVEVPPRLAVLVPQRRERVGRRRQYDVHKYAIQRRHLWRNGTHFFQ